jgi:hypothetical protein
MWPLVTGDHGATLAWDRAVLWDGAFRASSALLVSFALLVVSKRIEGVLAVLALASVPLGHDLQGALACVAAAVIGIRNTHSGWLRALCMASLAALAFTKVLFLPIAIASAAAIVAAPLLQRSWWSAAVRALFFTLALSTAWYFAARLPAVADANLPTVGAGAWDRLVGALALAWIAACWPGARAKESALGLALLALVLLGVAFAPGAGGAVPLVLAAIATQLVPLELEGRPRWLRVAVRVLPALGLVLALAASRASP